MLGPIDYHSLPDDPYMAFARLVEIFDDQLRDDIDGLERNDDSRQALVSHMNKIMGAARALEVDLLGTWEIPDYDDVYDVHRKFDLAVKGIVLQIQIQNARVTKIYSVSLDTATKARIHNLIGQIRELIDRSDLNERKRNSLFAKLNAFEADVDRLRTRFDNAMLAFVDLADVVHKGTETLKPITDLVKRINELIGGAKSEEPEPAKLPSPGDIKRVEPPKKQIEDFGRRSRELDDEIPF